MGNQDREPRTYLSAEQLEDATGSQEQEGGLNRMASALSNLREIPDTIPVPPFKRYEQQILLTKPDDKNAQVSAELHSDEAITIQKKAS